MAKHDEFLNCEIAKLLREGEEVQGTALIWKGPGVWAQVLLLLGLLAFLYMKFHFAVMTNQRLILIRTKMGFFSLKGGNFGVESIEFTDLVKAEVKGKANQRRLVMTLRSGAIEVVRLNTIARAVSGQKEFPDVAEQTFGRLLSA